ncbi:TrmH family RNA methyltransferase [Alicyclobacillus pomorum]|uniref:TrmH family RNA methyltransferase n=1 Tax=Alicyclobacillus pomorum TaxID=204470 RepID=UPI0004157085|nr:RNA methyltransferase [Alicyclobacillus pomorum]
MYLESPQNPRVKAWAALKTKKGRMAHGSFLVEGMRLVEELLRSSLQVDALLWDVGSDELPEQITDAALERGVPMFELSPGAFSTVSDTMTPQGVAAIAKIPDNAGLDKAQLASHTLLLDGVQDPGNVGTIIRSADAFAVGEVCCGTGTADPFSPKVVRATMGGLFRVPVLSCGSKDYVDAWRNKWPDGQVLVTAAGADLVCYEVDFQKPSLLAIGSEAFGVSRDIVDAGTHQVKIPMAGMAESLNAAIAGAVLLYEMFRQRQ